MAALLAARAVFRIILAVDFFLVRAAVGLVRLLFFTRLTFTHLQVPHRPFH